MPPKRHREIKDNYIERIIERATGSSVHITSERDGRIRNRRKADAISRLSISTGVAGKDTVAETNGRARASEVGTLTGQYRTGLYPRFTLRKSAIARRPLLIVRSGCFFSTVVVGVAPLGVSTDIARAEHATIRRALTSLRSFYALRAESAGFLVLRGNPRILGVSPTPLEYSARTHWCRIPTAAG